MHKELLFLAAHQYVNNFGVVGSWLVSKIPETLRSEVYKYTLASGRSRALLGRSNASNPCWRDSANALNKEIDRQRCGGKDWRREKLAFKLALASRSE